MMKLMKFGMFAAATLLTVALAAQGNKSLPDATVKTLDGKSVQIKSYTNKGKITVLSFWATWCAPCKREMDAIVDVYDDWKTKYDVQFLAVTIDTQRDLPKVKPMVSTKGWPYTFLSDAANQLKTALNFQTIPQTYLIDQKGNIVYEHTGYNPGDELDLEEKIKSLVKK